MKIDQIKHQKGPKGPSDLKTKGPIRALISVNLNNNKINQKSIIKILLGRINRKSILIE